MAILYAGIDLAKNGAAVRGVARILWAVMTRGNAFDADHLSAKPGTT